MRGRGREWEEMGKGGGGGFQGVNEIEVQFLGNFLQGLVAGDKVSKTIHQYLNGI